MLNLIYWPYRSRSYSTNRLSDKFRDAYILSFFTGNLVKLKYTIKNIIQKNYQFLQFKCGCSVITTGQYSYSKYQKLVCVSAARQIIIYFM